MKPVQMLARSHRLSVAPMMDWTDRHFRTLMRLLSPNAMLYTEMHVAQMLKHASQDKIHRALFFDRHWEDKVTVQLGGSDPELLAHSAILCEQFGYDEININVGCPSAKVAGAGRFGASLMYDPTMVLRICDAVSNAVGGRLPVSVKCRIGVVESTADLFDSTKTCSSVVDSLEYESLCHFVESVSKSNVVDHFIVHARNAVLGGIGKRIFSTSDNRKIPPLKHHLVTKLAREITPEQLKTHLLNDYVCNGIRENDQNNSGAIEGIMVGRVVRDDPFNLYALDKAAFSTPVPNLTRVSVCRQYANYLRSLKVSTPHSLSTELLDFSHEYSPHVLLKPVLNIFKGIPGGKLFRHELSEKMKLLKMKNIKQNESVNRAREETPGIVADILESAVETCIGTETID